MPTTNDRDLVARRTAGAGEPVHSRLDSLGNDPEDVLANTLRLVEGLNTQQDDYEATREARNKVNPADTLTGLPGIAGGLGALLAAALGRPDIGEGMLAGVQSGAQKGADRKTGQLDQEAAALQDDIKSGRSGLQMLFQARPESFLTPEGKDAIDPLVLGRALTGMPVPISAASIYNQKRRTMTEELQTRALTEMMVGAETVEGRRAAIEKFNSVGGYNLTSQQIDNLSNLASKSDTQMWQMLLQYFDPASVAPIMYMSFATGQTVQQNPHWLEYLAPKADPAAAPTIPGRILELTAQLSAWVQEDWYTRSRLTPEEQQELAFAGAPGDLMLWKNHFRPLAEDRGLSLGQLQREILAGFAPTVAFHMLDPERAKEVMGEVTSPQRIELLTGIVQSAIENAGKLQMVNVAEGLSLHLRSVEDHVYSTFEEDSKRKISDLTSEQQRAISRIIVRDILPMLDNREGTLEELYQSDAWINTLAEVVDEMTRAANKNVEAEREGGE